VEVRGWSSETLGILKKANREEFGRSGSQEVGFGGEPTSPWGGEKKRPSTPRGEGLGMERSFLGIDQN